LPPLRPLPYREVRRKIEAAGFVEVSKKGSHVKFAKAISSGVLTVIVPEHREIAVSTLRSILRQAGLSPDEFAQL
jgi:predicted RNA binding protein YcfA (HicA-like mRNA interferase family)